MQTWESPPSVKEYAKTKGGKGNRRKKRANCKKNRHWTGLAKNNLFLHSEIANRNIMDVELLGILRKFDAIGQSIDSEEMTLDEGLVRYREYLEVVKGSVNQITDK